MRNLFIFVLISLFVFGIVFIYGSKFIGKRTYTIAIIGDSLIDTMQTSFPYLTESLSKKFPDTDFKLYNYGIGAENVEKGLARFDQKLVYKDRVYPPMSSLSPDIIIVGSWAYNPFYPPDPQKHKQLLTLVIERAKATGAHVYELKELAPLSENFAKGVGGVEFSTEEAIKQSKRIIDLLQNVKGISDSQNIPLIDVYDKTKMADSEFGQSLYTNQTDGIHPSPLGHRLTADTIAQTIRLSHNNKSSVINRITDMLLDFTDIFHHPNIPQRESPEMVAGMGNMYSSETIFNNLINNNDLTSAISVFRFTKLNIPLSSTGKYTAFVPDNLAFEKLPKNSFVKFITAGNETQSIEQFSSYIVVGEYSSKDLKEGMILKTINGKNIPISKKRGAIFIENKAQIKTADIKSSNGVMHIIDSVF